MTKAAELAKMGEVLTNSQIGGRRNIIINGAMQVAQRGTSVSSITSSGYKTVDRWYTNASGATYSQSQESVTVGGETGLPVQFTNFLKHNVTTGNDNTAIYQYVEDVTSIPSGDVTISFYAKGTTPDGGLKARFFQNFGSGGSTEVELTSEIQSFTLTSTWQRFTATITIPSISGKTVGTSSKFIVVFGQGSSTSTDAWVLDVTGVQLEVGEQATPFEHRSFGEELALCQRYLYRHVDGNNACVGTIAYGRSTAQVRTAITFPVTMRATPSLDASSGSNYYKFENDISTIYATALGGVTNATTTGTEIYVNMSGITRGDARILLSANSSAYVDFDSEL
jgi:hypothetical protein